MTAPAGLDPLTLVAAHNPLPRDQVGLVSNPSERELTLTRILAQIDANEPAPPRAAFRWPLAAAVAATVVITITGVAFAAGVNPITVIGSFVGIRAANHAQTANDKLPPAASAQLQSFERHAGVRDELVPTSSRLIRKLPSGRSVYVVATKNGELWVVLVKHGKLEVAFAGNPLSQTRLVTGATMDPDGPRGPIPPLSWGLARNGITAVSFRAHNQEQTVRVIHNVWAYEGTNNSLKEITVHYTNGTTRTIARGPHKHGRHR